MKNKRIGFLTLGITLVAFGILFLLRLAFPAWNFLFVLKFWPVTLILLGIEVLITAFLPAKEGEPPRKIDVVSLLLIFVVLLFAMGMAAVEEVFRLLPEVAERAQAAL
ncbi:MAG: DUF5668 domain-containing protein [Oscillospiraceae bacterium]|jgi:uncharacterized membrane protein HdeD (DUF308 family)|nr:DUF5668 domain-containing protein [Oscillospiraceae bacterium]